MRSNRFSSAYFLTLIFMLFVLAGEQSVLAQSKNSRECADGIQPDPTSVRPLTGRTALNTPRQPQIILDPLPQRQRNYQPPTPPPRAVLENLRQQRLVLAPPPHPRAILDSLQQPQLLLSPPLIQAVKPITFTDFTSTRQQQNPAVAPLVDLKAAAASTISSFTLVLDETEAADSDVYTLCSRDGRTIYEGSNADELCRKMNQEADNQGSTAIDIELGGLNTQKNDAARFTVTGRQRRIHPNRPVLLSPSEVPLIESSIETQPVRRKGLFKRILKLEGKTGTLTFYNAVKERLNYFVDMVRSRLSSDLKYMSVEDVIRKARADFQKTYPGAKMTIEFRSEAGASHWVRIPPRQGLRELWLKS